MNKLLFCLGMLLMTPAWVSPKKSLSDSGASSGPIRDSCAFGKTGISGSYQKDTIAPLNKIHAQIETDKTENVTEISFPYHTFFDDDLFNSLRSLRHLRAVRLFWADANDTVLERLGGLQRIEELEIHLDPDRSSIGTQGPPKNFKTLHMLRILRLDGVGVSDLLLQSLVPLRHLQQLHLNGTSITDTGLGALNSLRNLEALALQSGHITGSGLAVLGSLPRLHSLLLNHNPITDAGLERLKGVRHLELLGLEQTNITGDGLGCLRGMKTLRQLDLGYNPGINDAGTKHLVQLMGLTGLTLYQTRISAQGIDRLRSALLNAKIGY